MTPTEFLNDLEAEVVKYGNLRITPFKQAFFRRVWPNHWVSRDEPPNGEWFMLTFEAQLMIGELRQRITDSVTAALTR